MISLYIREGWTDTSRKHSVQLFTVSPRHSVDTCSRCYINAKAHSRGYEITAWVVIQGVDPQITCALHAKLQNTSRNLYIIYAHTSPFVIAPFSQRRKRKATPRATIVCCFECVHNECCGLMRPSATNVNKTWRL